MKLQTLNPGKMLFATILLCNLIHCNDNKTNDMHEPAAKPDFSIHDMDSTLLVAVYPSAILRQGPEITTPVDAKLQFGERVTLDTERYRRVETEVLGLKGRWLPVTYKGESGWIFSALLRESNSDVCYISEAGKLTQESCSTMEKQKLHCLRFDSKIFPDDFQGACTYLSFFHMEEPEHSGDCSTAYAGVLAPDGSIERNFQVHNGYNGTWHRDGDALILTIEFWQESCYEGCRYGGEHKECENRCKDEPAEKWKEERTFRVTQPEVGLPEIQQGDKTMRICFTPYWSVSQ